MTATTKPTLTARESDALRRLGVPLDHELLEVTVTWHERWKDAGPAHFTRLPMQWIAEWRSVTVHQVNSGMYAIEYGPDYVEDAEDMEDYGVLNDLADSVNETLARGDLDPETGLDVEVNGWALKVLGLLDGLDIDGEKI